MSIIEFSYFLFVTLSADSVLIGKNHNIQIRYGNKITLNSFNWMIVSRLFQLNRYVHDV